MKSALIAAASTLLTAGLAVAAHPQILVTPEDRDNVQEKIQTQPWAGHAIEQTKQRVDPYLAKLEEDPEYLTSRLAMNWDTHYAQDLTAKSRWIGGEGRAPVPTPRFAGARNWATEWGRPGSIDDFRPGDQLERLYLGEGGRLAAGKQELTKAGEWTANAE